METWWSAHDYMPFGDELFAGTGARTTGQGYLSVGSTPGVNTLFTGQYRDTELASSAMPSGLDHFLARRMAPGLGRFLQPDPGNLGAVTDYPQTWNMYSYVINNPFLWSIRQELAWLWTVSIRKTVATPAPLLRTPTITVTEPAPPPVTFDDCTFCETLMNGGNWPNVADLQPSNAPPPTRKNSRSQNPSCTAMQARASKLAGLLENVSSQSGWLAFGSGVGAVLSGAAEGPTAGLDTPATITLGGMSSFFGTVSLVSGGVAASLDSYASRNTGAIWNFDVSQLTNLAAKAAASKLPLVKPWAERIGDLAEQASDLALKAKGGCE